VLDAYREEVRHVARCNSLSVERFDNELREQWSSAADLDPMVRRKPFGLLRSTLRVLRDELARGGLASFQG
jgi:hypothetical protein